ncbi:MAG: uroporphyrinogen-III synthase [Pseudomonadota bacterium]
MAARPSPLVLITRPEESARRIRQDLEAKGYATLVEPMLTIERLGSMARLSENVQAIVLTSAHAVKALNAEAKELPVFAVGKATTEAAQVEGCAQVISGDGDGADLARLIGEQLRPEGGVILHVAGEHVRDDLNRILEDQGFKIHREIVYRAHASTGLSKAVTQAWQAREIAAVLLFSPRTAEILVHLLIEHGLADHVDRTTAICVSESTATPCRTLDWRTICLAARPNREALIRALEGSISVC